MHIFTITRQPVLLLFFSLLSFYASAQNKPIELSYNKLPLSDPYPQEEIDTATDRGTISVVILNADSNEKKNKVKSYKFYHLGSGDSPSPITVQPQDITEKGDTVTIQLKGLNAIFGSADELSVAMLESDAPNDTLMQVLLKKKKPEENKKDQPGATPAAPPTASNYLKAIKCKYPSFVENQAFKEGNINYIFTYIDSNNKIFKVPGTEFPDCNASSSIYRMVFLTTDSVKYKPVVVAKENLVGSDLVGNIGGTSATAQSGKSKGPCDTIQLVQSQLIGPYDLGVDITISIQGNNQIRAYTISIPACSIPYHFSVIGGFYASSLNSPDNIASATINGVETLVADNPTSQKAITIMAVFHPNPRDRYYKYKELDFWDKWSVCFGTKLSQNLFDDLLLGLNYEFAKGGSFAGGVHYGQHTVIAGYKNFKFGKDYFQGTFDTTKTRQRWDFGIFFGVNIDFRVITFIRGGADRTPQSTKPTTTGS